MLYRPLGNTGKEISAISFGGMRFKPEEYKKDHQICANIVLRAHELGINHIDSAPDYCDNQSEEIIGRAMKQIRGKRPYVSSKCGLWLATTADEAYELIKQSRDKLCVDTIDFYYMWCVKNMDEYRQMIAPGGIYEGLLRAQQDGLIAHICTSAHVDGATMKEIVDDGKSESILLGYNALNFAYRRDGIKACQDANLGVIVMNPLGGGLIPDLGDQFGFLKQDPADSIVHAALRFVVGTPGVSAALPGIADIPMLEDCVAALDRGISMRTEEDFTRLGVNLKSELNTLCTSCTYCDHCPMDVPIVALVESYNQHLLGRPTQAVLDKIRNDWGKDPKDAAKCTACGLCEPLCTQKLPIIERLREIAEWAK